MKQDSITLVVPKSFAKDNSIHLPLETELKIDGNLSYFEFAKPTKPFIPYLNLLIVGIITLFTSFLLYKDFKQIPLTGTKSAATLIIIIGFFTSLINFTYMFIKHKKNTDNHAAVYISWRIFPIILLSYGVLIGVGSLFGFRILGQFFYDASFDIFTSSIITCLFVLFINYIMINLANHLSPTSIIRTLTAIILGGVGIAMITNKDQQWWLANLSFLGTPEASNSWEFNLTLIFSALLMIALIDYLFVLLYEKLGKNNRLKLLKILLVATAISLGGVGFFPYNDSLFSQSMHNRVAGYLVYLFLILIISIRWLIPNVGKSFLKISYTIGILLIISLISFLGLGYLSLTAFELIAFVLSFSWLLMLLQYLIQMINKPTSSYHVTIISQEI